jgi:spermidine synthase
MSAAVRVREGRDGRELRVSGTLASLYRPGSPTTGLIWDALAAPLTLLPAARRRAVLVLGLGGGSAARVARALAPSAHIVGVELAADVVEAARRDLDLDRLGLEIHVEDAQAFLARERRRFDAVLEDIFAGDTRGVHKPSWLMEDGYRAAAARLRPGGVMVSNTISETIAVTRRVRRLFPRSVWIGTRDYENRMVVSGADVDATRLRRAVAAETLLAEVLPRLTFTTPRVTR